MNDTRSRIPPQSATHTHANDVGEREDRHRGFVEYSSEARFETLANGSPVLLWVNGVDGCEFVNDAYRRFLGVPADDDVRGYDWSRFVHPEDRDGYLQSYLAAFSARAPFTAEFRFRRNDGSWRWMQSEATPRVRDGAFQGYVGATVDITERKHAEIALRRSEDALREADRRKNEFLAVLAHELRNPLAPIRTALTLLRISDDKPALLERLRPAMERQIAHMVRLIDDLLDVARITSGRIQLQRTPTAIAELVHAAVEANRAALDAAGLRLDVDLPVDPCFLDVDPTRFVQVLSNILHNASKFTEAGGRIELRAHVEPPAVEPMLEIAICDTGAGIAPEMLPRVFDLFAQAGEAGRGRTGLGIGLALARQLIEMHGGSIAADSEGVDRGSRFTIRMPAVPMAVSPVQDEAPHAPPRVTRRVLIVDDNPDAAETLALLVSTLGGEAQTAYDGEGALRCAAAFRPDVILLDIGMPGMDGYETCRRLRAGPSGQDALVVALTGWGSEEDRRRTAEAGFDDHLTKPADPQLLEHVLAGSRAAR
jgi:PAS domain S-box-containing protein